MGAPIVEPKAWRMSDPIRGQIGFALRMFVALAAIAFAIGFINAWLEGLGFLLLIFGIPVAALSALAGTVLLLVRGFRCLRSSGSAVERFLAVCAGPVLLAAVFLSFAPLLATGVFVGDLARLGANQSRYQEIVALARTRRQTEWYAEKGGITYNVDIGPPVRVAFNPAGILDNWSGIVFDPTGDVMLADGFDASGKFRAVERITKLFGGDLVGCRRLWGDYYKCSFT